MREEIGLAFPDVMAGHVSGDRGAFEVYVNEQLIFCRVLSQSVDIPITIKIMKIIKVYTQNILRILFNL